MSDLETYDANRSPRPDQWLALDESERIDLVLAYHRNLSEPHPGVPNMRAHAVFHTVVENQAALGAETPVQAALERLVTEGLSRHEAVHAVAFLLAGLFHDILGSGRDRAKAEKSYYRQVRKLSAAWWRGKSSES